MKEEIKITFKDQTGLRISEGDISTGKIVINGIEITSIEDWEKVTKSIIDLQSQLKAKEEVVKEAREYIKEHIRIDDEYPAYMEMLITERDELIEILSKGENK